jgi:ATP-dependent Lon protease, bacterial type
MTDFKISLLQHEYRRYTQLLQNQNQHIETLYKENYININVRNNCMKILSEIICFLNNDVYNAKLKDLRMLRNNDEVVTNFKIDSLSNKYNTNNSTNNNEDNTNNDNDMSSNNENNNVDSPDGVELNDNNDSSDVLEIDTETTNEYSDNNTNKPKKHKNKTRKNKNSRSNKSEKYMFDLINSYLKYSNNNQLLNELCKIEKISKMRDLILEDFGKMSDKLLKLCSEVGFYSVDDALNLLIGYNYKELVTEKLMSQEKKPQEKLIEFKEMFDLYNSIFVPVSYKIQNLDIPKQDEFYIKSNMIVTPSNEIYIDSYAEVSILYPEHNQIIIMGGYFISDSIQCVIRTSQISKHFIYKKKRAFILASEKLKSVNPVFANVYMKNLSVGELLSYDEKEFLEKLESDFKKYSTLSKMNFKNLMDEFTKDSQNNLKNMYTIIRLLLLGPDDCINIAGLLFGLTKDKKYGAEIIAEIIYRRLTYTLQMKLKKSALNIKSELEKLKNLSETDIDIRKQLAANNNIPIKIKKLIFDKLEEQKFNSSETTKNKIFVDILSNYPWNDVQDISFETIGKSLTKSREFMDNVARVLNKQVYGHKECKRVIQEIICKWLMNPKSIGKALGLVGPPGVGKTLIAKGLGEALGIPCCSISLCGVEDAAVLNGHSFTYSAAQPGLIVRKMVEAGKARCILFFDELDKTSRKYGTDEIQNVLINLTDQNMNAAFNDKFFQEVTFPLDKVLFVFSYNDKRKVDKILLNRIHQIDVKAYTAKDKLKICQDFLLKEIVEGIGLEHKSILISDEDIDFIVDNYTYEPGVRDLKRKIDSIFSRISADIIYQRGLFLCNCKKEAKELNNIKTECLCEEAETCDICKVPCKNNCGMNITPKNPIIVTRDIIKRYLPKPNIEIEKIHKENRIGMVNGLYATDIGYGGIIKIIIFDNYNGKRGEIKLSLTGNQGDIMQQSATFSYTTAMNLLKREYVQKFMAACNYGLHVHTPDGATPKDGPSAGAAFTTAFISYILGMKVKNNIAMTGEIGEYGEVKQIGGLLYKLRGAKKAGVTLVFYPESNEKDIEDIKTSDKTLIEPGVFDVVPVSNIKEILRNSLIDETQPDKIFDPNVYLKDF